MQRYIPPFCIRTAAPTWPLLTENHTRIIFSFAIQNLTLKWKIQLLQTEMPVRTGATAVPRKISPTS